MKIHKLEIQGFKSFADRVALRFGEGITGVVGPNGCGKSNVVDALRWVMGEMSAKHLRGASMQDVIFNGSQVRGPMGMAEVTVTFKNDGQLVPIEYQNLDYIQVTRRLFRDGESDYLINKTPCRLKDITELFLGTGIGKAGFSIIQQGQVSTLVKAKADDRRRIIEEAAGITKYKERRRQAERKMEATRHNLERVTDVTTELSRRLGSLKRQAQKAERYKRVKSEIREIELRNAALAWLELTTALRFEREHARDEQERLVGGEARIAELEVRIETERLKMLDDDQRLAQAQSKLYELDTAISLGEQQSEHATESIEAGRKREETAREELGGLREALSFIEAQRSDLEKGADELEAESDSHETALADANEALETLTQRRATFSRDNEELRARVLQGATRAAEAARDLENLEGRREEIYGGLETIASELGAVMADITEHDETIERLNVEAAQAADERTDREAERARTMKELEEKKETFEAVNDKVEIERTAVGDKKSRLKSLEQIHASYEGSPEGVRALMQREGNAERGVVGLLADLFEVPATVERAVEAALGPRLQTIVANNAEAAWDALAYLRDTDHGRAEVIVKDAVEPAPARVSLEGARPIAATLSIPEWHRDVVESVLGRIYVTDEGVNAWELWARARACGLTLVTPEGEVLAADGAIRGGALQDTSHGLLRLKRELRELSEQVADEEQKLAVAIDERDALARDVGGLTARVEELGHEGHRLELLHMEKKQALARAEDERSRLGQRRDEQRAARSKAAEELTALEAQIDVRAEQRDAAERQRAESIGELESADRVQAELEQSIRAQTDEVTHLKVRVAAHSERRENLRQSLEHHERNEKDVGERVDRLEAQVKETLDERARLEQATLDAKSRIAALVQERSAIKGTLDADREAYEADAEAVRSLEHEARDARRAVDAVRTALNELSIRVRERELELDALAQRTEDNHHVRPQDAVFDFHLQPIPQQDVTDRVRDLRRQIDNMGEINLTAIEESKELEERYTFLKGQSDDLTHALAQLEKAIIKINRTTKRRFREAFEAINENFQKVFPRLFRGGKAWLAMTDPSDLLTTGVEIYAQPPGKKLASVALMSGGEQALTAVSLIFSIFLIKPSPFCLLDEVDAPLDEANVSRFNEMVKDVSSISQFIVITHNKKTMESADQLYGVTMEEAGVSKMVNVRMS
jgi:chromosome segregation protein